MVQVESLPAHSGCTIMASSPRPGHGQGHDASILLQDQDRVDKMEQTIRNLNQKVNDLQNQGNNTMGAQDLVTIMETSEQESRTTS